MIVTLRQSLDGYSHSVVVVVGVEKSTTGNLTDVVHAVSMYVKQLLAGIARKNR